MDCPFCEKINPPDARFCNACGAQLNLVPCPRCGAVNESTAQACFQCNAGLGGNLGDAEAVAPPEAAASPAHTKRASTEHRFEVMELMAAGATDGATARYRRPQWSVRRAYGAGLLLVVLAAISGAVYVAKRAPAIVEPSHTSISDAAYATRPIRAGTVIDTPQPVKPAPATPRSNAAAGPGTPCTQGVAALGLCNPARDDTQRAASGERTQQAATTQ